MNQRQPGEGGREAVAERRRLTLGDILRAAGPGIITGGADNDPAGIATYSVVGAQSGFSQNWLLLLSTPLLIVIQQMSARIGNVTKNDFATAIRTHFGRNVALTIVLLAVGANVITIGADLLIMAAVASLVTGLRYLYFIVPFALAMSYVSIFADYKVFSRYLLWLVA
ncbi:MAG TPA: divalent metal cation transporter, partial [Dehalococcoidia bacterium]|nr:divalent metal cation transporter [Dehalococcoidia bacterium]